MNRRHLPIREDSPTNPINPYGESKLMVENDPDPIQRGVWDQPRDLPLLQCGRFVRALGEDHRPETHVIPVAIEAITGKRDTFTVFGTDYATADGTAIRDYVHVQDLVEAHILVLDKLDTPQGVFNLGTRSGFSVSDVVASGGTHHRSRPAGCLWTAPGRRSPSLIADSTRARTELGWNPIHSTLDLMIGSHWDWAVSHPDGYPV